jgi:hypothetical protein
METLPATLEKALFGKDLGLGFDLGLITLKKSVYSQYS